MSWQVIAAMTGATNRSHSRRWVSACLADHGLPAGCRAGDRYQAIRSAPGRSRFGASAVSRSVTFSSLAASRSSDAASHCRRTPFSYQTARHRPPATLRRVHRHPALQLHHHTAVAAGGRAGIPAQQSAGPCRVERSRAAASGAGGPPGPGAGRLWGFCGDLGLRGCFRHHGMPALPGVFAGKAGCSAVTEPVWPENDKPPEKRKVMAPSSPASASS